MLQNLMLSAKPWQKLIFNFISLILLCIATLGFMLCIAAFGITKIDTPEYILIPLTTILLTLSSFLDSYALGKIFKEKGIMIGCCVAGILSVIVITLAVHFDTFSFSNILYSKLLAVTFAGILGGILGVN